MNVQLPPVSTGRLRGEEAGEGVLAIPAGHPPMGDEGGARTSGHRGEGAKTTVAGRTRTSPLNIAGQPASAYQTDMPDLITAGDDAEIDRALIARWNGGDQRAATMLVERHAPSLARFVGSLGVITAPEEIVQDTFVRAFGSLDSFRGDSTFRTWLLTISRNLLRDRQRGRKRARLHVEVQDDDLVSSSDALEGAVASETERRLRSAVETLSPLQRSIFTLRVTEGLSYKEIAIAVGSTEGAARVHYHNAMRAIREKIDE